MHRRILTFAAGVAAMSAALAACSSSTTGPGFTVPDSAVDNGIANDAGDEIATSIELMGADEQSDGASAEMVRAAPALQLDVARAGAGTDCSGPDGDGWYTCVSTWHQLTLTNSWRFWDGDALALSFTAATDSVNHRHQLAGSYVQGWFPNRTVWVNNNDTATLAIDRAASPVQHVWNKVGVRQDSSQYVNLQVTRHWHYTSHDTASAVTFDMPRTQYPWPMSGSIVHNVAVHFVAVKASGTYTRDVTRRVMVTFTGTQDVTLQVGGLTCTLDLLSHQVSGCTGS